MEEKKIGLKSDVLGLLGAATLGVVFLSPAMTLYGLFGPTFLSSGSAAPLAFVFALIATLPTASSYALLSRDYPSSGSAADWATRAIGDKVGIWTGWVVFLYYFTNFIIQPVALGLFFGDLLSALEMTSNMAHVFGFFLGVVVCLAWPAWLVYRGISVSTKSALAFLLFETIIVLALCGTILVLAPHRGTPLNLTGFSFKGSVGGVPGLFSAMIFAMLGFCGFDVVSTVAEETKMAKKLIPQATILCLVVFASFIIVGVWALTFGGNASHLREVAESGRMPITDIAASFWGRGSVLVTLTGISATFGLAIVTAVGASRILFSMGRNGHTSKVFSELHPTYRVPWKSLHVIFAGGLIGSLIAYFSMGAYNSYVWWATTSTFFAMVTYLFVNFAVLVLFRKKIFQSFGGFFLYGAIPVFGIVADIYLVIESFFIELWNGNWATGKSIVIFDTVCAITALVLTFRVKKSVPLVSQELYVPMDKIQT